MEEEVGIDTIHLHNCGNNIIKFSVSNCFSCHQILCSSIVSPVSSVNHIITVLTTAALKVKKHQLVQTRNRVIGPTLANIVHQYYRCSTNKLHIRGSNISNKIFNNR